MSERLEVRSSVRGGGREEDEEGKVGNLVARETLKISRGKGG